MSGSTHHDLTLFTFKEKSFTPETSFDDSSISRCESASSNPLLCVLATLGSLRGLSAEGNALSAARAGSRPVPDKKEKCLNNKKANSSVFVNILEKPKQGSPSPSDWIRRVSLADCLSFFVKIYPNRYWTPVHIPFHSWHRKRHSLDSLLHDPVQVAKVAEKLTQQEEKKSLVCELWSNGEHEGNAQPEAVPVPAQTSLGCCEPCSKWSLLFQKTCLQTEIGGKDHPLGIVLI